MAVWVSEDGPIERKKPGAKTNRSETVTVRLDPRLNYLCELAARAQRRTKSSFIEWAVETSLQNVTLAGSGEWGEKDPSIDQLATRLWDVDEPDRLAALAFNAPILMTHDEQVIWKVIKEYGYLWRGQFYTRTSNSEYEEWTWTVSSEYLVPDRLRETFDAITKVAAGEATIDILPTYNKSRKVVKPSGDWGGGSPPSSGFADDLDSDIPF